MRGGKRTRKSASATDLVGQDAAAASSSIGIPSLTEQLSDLVDRLAEKRPTVRDAAASALLDLLVNQPYGAVQRALDTHGQTLQLELRRCIKRSPSTVGLLVRLYAMVACALEISDDDPFYSDAFELLRWCLVAKESLADDGGGGAETTADGSARADCIRTLALLCVVCAESAEAATGSLMDQLLPLLDAEGPVAAGAAQSVAFLVATGNNPGLARLRTVTARLMDSMQSQVDVDARIACGEALACMAELAAQRQDLSDEFLTVQSEVMEATLSMVNLGRGGATAAGGGGSSKRVQKRDRAAQKSSFRDIHDTIASFPACRADAIEGGSWHTNACYQVLSTVYGDGLSGQIATGNNIVRTLVGMDAMDTGAEDGDGDEDSDAAVLDRKLLIELSSSAKKERQDARERNRADKRAERDENWG